jgi:hypothetical protein
MPRGEKLSSLPCGNDKIELSVVSLVSVSWIRISVLIVSSGISLIFLDILPLAITGYLNCGSLLLF